MLRRPCSFVAAVVTTVIGVGLAVTVPTSGMQSASAALRAVTGTTTLLPGIVQQGARPAGADRAKVPGTVRFSPAQRGRPVVIERQIGDGVWEPIDVKRQNAAGVVTFVAPADDTYSYRGVAKRYNGSPKVAALPMSVASWSPLFSDQFAGTALDSSNWDYRGLRQRVPSRLKSVSSESAVAVDGGTLRLMVKKDPSEAGRFLNGHVGTAGKFDFTHGVAAARIKFPRGRGQHGAFWMQPTAVATIPGDAANSGAEIDVAEYFGDGYQDGGLASFLYNYGILDSGGDPKKIGGLAPKATRMLSGKDDWWKSYHVFSVEWTPREYVFRVDGREHYRTRQGVSGIDEYLILSLLTSDWELPKLNTASLPSTMHVDWVRVWQR